ncbi:glycosyltransferase [Hymenobacter psychrotolerans]|uniref:Glycosyltransferase, catalytic subunit of cellulose synthase and poly-beta-1,6-N-acetylglucosamine synthase n=1 Tax=Hymenobacter psychrotolerans DSM 18569 TaxID=1121959 RepID=A0A1M7DHQ0_9BACT|nr:glycosyltransferase [Hymenobacter psychrotolerans]SHL78995.1 Glycosyltransferase, catalytic subunit of cellulose synthase and poly-beta-1,6-N-acetylglucosamine synthase [Hymenobacter psychrotolerans DSM 18569]
MSTWLGLVLLAAPALYAAQMLRFRRAWDKLPVPKLPPLPAPGQHEERPRFSVLIAARNEAENLPLLLADLRRQTLPAPQFEVLIVDDHSTDATAEVAAADSGAVEVRVIRLAEVPGAGTGKKAALQAALAQARAPWVVCTDADCRLHPDWLRSYAALLAEAGPEVRFVSGPVLLTGPETWLASLSGLEFAGLVGTGAASIGAGLPTMCNGANLAYHRDAFAAVAGFAGNEHLASGDDEFLMHKLHAAFPGSIRFLKHPAALVRTAGPPTLAALLRQRVRWASKWRHYRHPASQRLAVLVLLANVALAAGALALPWLPVLAPWAATAWLLKLGADVWFLSPVLRFLGRRRWLWWVPVLQLAYAPYALAVGLAGLRGGYVWKGRAVK